MFPRSRKCAEKCPTKVEDEFRFFFVPSVISV